MDYPLIVLGAGAAGLVIAIGSAKAGKKVLLIDRGTWGGDCTHFGCIPSKSLIASAKIARNISNAANWGIESTTHFSADGALTRVRHIVATIADHEEPPALAKIGIASLTGTASFIDSHTLKVLSNEGKETTVTGRKIVIATGSSAAIPDTPGLATIPYLTNETIFELKTPPQSLLILGGGPIGCELAQAFAALGTKVTLIQRPTRLLPKEDPEVHAVLARQFEKQGITLYTGTQVRHVAKEGELISLQLEKPDRVCKANQLLVATGRRPNLEKLNLEAAMIASTPKGITVDAYGRTSQKHIFAVGDVSGQEQFTHVAENRARTILQNLLLPIRSKFSTQPVPHVTYTAPEVASIGLTEEQAAARYGASKIATYFVPMNEVDRAITAGETEGFVKIVTKKWSSHILGATIVAARAGEMLMELSVAMHCGLPLRKLSGVIHPYPTYSLAIRKAADQWLTQTVLGTLNRWRSHGTH